MKVIMDLKKKELQLDSEVTISELLSFVDNNKLMLDKTWKIIPTIKTVTEKIISTKDFNWSETAFPKPYTQPGVWYQTDTSKNEPLTNPTVLCGDK